jgi:hypothetical protein
MKLVPVNREQLPVDEEVPALKNAWAAGFIDGEGCISVAHAYKDVYQVRVQVSQKFDGPLLVLKALYGGFIHQRSDNSQFQWQCNGSNGAKFLVQILPYLILKKGQAELALEFENQRKVLASDEKEVYSKVISLMKKEA